MILAKQVQKIRNKKKKNIVRNLELNSRYIDQIDYSKNKNSNESRGCSRYPVPPVPD
jgi:hypothetical protein